MRMRFAMSAATLAAALASTSIATHLEFESSPVFRIGALGACAGCVAGVSQATDNDFTIDGGAGGGCTSPTLQVSVVQAKQNASCSGDFPDCITVGSCTYKQRVTLSFPAESCYGTLYVTGPGIVYPEGESRAPWTSTDFVIFDLSASCTTTGTGGSATEEFLVYAASSGGNPIGKCGTTLMCSVCTGAGPG